MEWVLGLSETHRRDLTTVQSGFAISYHIASFYIIGYEGGTAGV
jgi:hypothetical protein